MDRHFMRRSATWGLVATVLTMCGCSFFPEALQPQNLQKLNRGPAPSNDPFFSVQDRTPNYQQSNHQAAIDPFHAADDHVIDDAGSGYQAD
ncbi:MAG: hypothetical protein V4719_27420 [Planctomycetota bacterium]